MQIQSSAGMRPAMSMQSCQQRIQADASAAFQTLDRQQKGYLELSDFAAALQKLQDNSSSEQQANEMFQQLDADQDGQLTATEFTSAVSELYSALASGGPRGMAGAGPRGMPPPQEDAGKTVDELTAMQQAASSEDPRLAADLATLVAQFDSADQDGDGQVSAKEAMAFREQQQDSSDSPQNDDGQQLLQRTLVQLLKTYGSTANTGTAADQHNLTVTV